MKLLIILLLFATTATAQTKGFVLRTDTLMYVNGVGDTVRINKTRSAVNNIFTKGAGTNYTLTATSAKVTFGTTSVTIVNASEKVL